MMKILTVISNYNEEKSILECIDDFRKNSSIESDLLVIDNCSSDQSVNLIKNSGVEYLTHCINTGSSQGVIKTSMLFAQQFNYDIYCHMDGDNQHHSKELKKLTKQLIENNADIVIGSRFIEGKGFQSYFFRRIGINLFSKLISKITGYIITDITSGFVAYNKRAITVYSNLFKHEIVSASQWLLVATLSGLRLIEVPVIMKERVHGKSEFNLINSLKFPFFEIISLVGTLLQKKFYKKHGDYYAN